MARTLVVAVLSLASLGSVFVCAGSWPEPATLGTAPPVAEQSALAQQRGGGERTQSALDPVGTQVSALSAHALPPELVRPLRLLEASIRPQMRDFWATGPLVLRLTDPTFGPQTRPADLLIPDPPAHLAGASDLLCIAVAVYHEARGEPLDGQLAVASVILNRTKEPERWGATPCEVVVPVQFSFLSTDGSYSAIPKDEAWAIAVEMAREALERGPSPLVGEADHYHTPAVDPDWDEDMDQVVQIQGHIFFVDPLTKG